MIASEPLDTTFSPASLDFEYRGARSSTRESFRSIVASVEIIADFATNAAGICASYCLYFSLRGNPQTRFPFEEMTAVASIVATLIFLLLEVDGAYRGGSSLLRIRETERTIRIPWQSLLLFLPITLLLGRTFSRGALLLALLLVPAFLMIQKQLLTTIVGLLHAHGYGVRRVVIYGAGHTGKRVFSALIRSAKLGLWPVMAVDDDPQLTGRSLFELDYQRKRSVAIEQGPITAELLKSCGCELLVIAIPNLSREKFPRTLQAAMQAGVEVAFLPNWAITDDQWTGSIDIDGLLLTSAGNPGMAWHYQFAKRAFDILGSLILLVILSPLLLLVPIAVRLDSPGPVFFKQKRVGKNGRLFTMYKFRSMRTDAPTYEASPSAPSDPRITRLGRWLRRTSLDETAQIFNVLKGDMSLVGPRPEMPFIVEQYDSRQRQRLQVIPGITGLWQLSADRAFHIHENIQYDLYYIRNRSFFLDLAVIVHTAFYAVRGV